MNPDSNYQPIPFVTTRCPRCAHEFHFWFRAPDAYEDWQRSYITKLESRVQELQAQLPRYDVQHPSLRSFNSPPQ